MRSQHLFFVELVTEACVVLHDPVLEVAAHAVVEGGEFGIQAAHAADQRDQRDQRGEFADGLRAGGAVELAVGLLHAQRAASSSSLSLRMAYSRWMVLMHTWLSLATNEDLSRCTVYSSVNLRVSSIGT
jgi:hypothetical protein